MDRRGPNALNCFPCEMGGVDIRRPSRIVTIVDGVQVTEVTVHDQDGDPVETYYVVKGERLETLKEAMEAARNGAERET